MTSPRLTYRNRQRAAEADQSPHDYAMYELDPWPEDDDDNTGDKRAPSTTSQSSKSPAFAPATVPSLPRSPSPDAWQAKSSSPSSFGSPSRPRPKVMFAGPPPPIASSVMMSKSVADGRRSAGSSLTTGGQSRAKQPGGLGSLLFDYRREPPPTNRQDTVWRGIRRREEALEKELQQLLDLQANGLVAGRDGVTSSGTDTDGRSDTGSSTPTGTFYSTATSKSRMANSLHIPTRSTADGNVIPVRQPKSSRPKGLRSARSGLRRTMAALAQLKAEEEAHIDDALADRARALGYVNRLSQRKESVSNELRTLEGDEEEPLGKELRSLGTKYDAVTNEIRELEEKLVGMRNQRRWLRGRIEDVRNRREAGLSGYRGALRNVDSEVAAIMARPPVQPLDLEAVDPSALGNSSSAGGAEFMRMIPERRTVEMVKTWWSAEVSVLEKRKTQVNMDREALEEGGAVWAEVTQLVSAYESRLRRLMEDNQPDAGVSAQQKGDMIQQQMEEMQRVIKELGVHQRHAEERRWNLLICAIGAELEAFTEAREMLEAFTTDGDGDGDGGMGDDGARKEATTAPEDSHTIATTVADGQPDRETHDESDNEVPPDLLVSQADDSASNVPSMASPDMGPGIARTESESDVPAEFLAEHRDKMD